MNADVPNFLAAARALIADPTHWCIGACARDQDGVSVASTDEKAVSWCARGALERITYGMVGDGTYDDVNGRITDETRIRTQAEALAVLARVGTDRHCGRKLSIINDSLGHDAIIEMYDIALMRSRYGTATL